MPNAPDNPDQQIKQPPYYLNVQLPGQAGTRFQLTSAVTPNADHTAARCGRRVTSSQAIPTVSSSTSRRLTPAAAALSTMLFAAPATWT